ncbi:MAG: hypothetical protein H6737_05045 [Alphaproteobacteria bacterium]|nr:hypothetical protein [Myxococcales bacterium]MCB9674461.1 hypothetical protein [Alphaproteobacteria bacterium]
MLVTWLLACGSAEPVAPEAPATHAAILKAADAHDGVEDHVVSECGGCSLAMKGDPAHSVEVDGYALHFCSASCKDAFEADVEGGMKRIGNAATR